MLADHCSVAFDLLRIFLLIPINDHSIITRNGAGAQRILYIGESLLALQ